jgi:hypothetical protein
MILAEAVLAVHLAIILFNVFGLIAVPVGAAYGWRFVRVGWCRHCSQRYWRRRRKRSWDASAF